MEYELGLRRNLNQASFITFLPMLKFTTLFVYPSNWIYALA